jgi:hypothetical protein
MKLPTITFPYPDNTYKDINYNNNVYNDIT